MNARSLIATSLLVALVAPATVSASPLTVWPLPAEVGDDAATFELCAIHQGAVPAENLRIEQPLDTPASLIDAEPAARVVGDNAVWHLGTLAPGQSVCVEATISGGVAAPTVRAVAGGELVFTAARGAEPADPTAPVGALSGPFDAFVLAEVARHGGDPDRIIAFVREDIDWVPYEGSMRGARGTLWAREGNALDRAVLLTQMLRAAGTPAQLARGTIDDAQVDALLATLQPDWNRIVSAPPAADDLVRAVLELEGAAERLEAAGLPSAPSAMEAELRELLFDHTEQRSRWASGVSDHWWVERYEGAWTPTPTLFDTAPAPLETHLEVPEALQHTVTIELFAELYNPAFSTVIGDFDSKLLWTAPTADLVGRPATLWIESEVDPRGGLVFSSTERDFYPTLRIGGEVVATGDAFTELLTNFPLASTFVLGVEMNITLTAPDGSQVERTHVISDRLGAALRTGYGSGGDLTFSPMSEVSGLTGLDTVTVSLGAGSPSPTERLRIRAEMQRVRIALEQVFPLLQEIVDATEDGRIRDEADQLAADTALRLGLEANTAQGEFIAARFLDDSALFSRQMAQESLVTMWDARPRLVVSGIRSTSDGGAPFIDLARHDVEVWAPEGVPNTATTRFQLVRSEFEAELEAQSVVALAPDDVDGAEIVSLETVWAAADEAGVPIRELQPGDADVLARMNLDLDSQALIFDALERGQTVFTPDRMVTLGSVEAVVWIELDPETGRWISVGSNGWRIAAVQYASMQRVLSKGLGVYIGGLQGFTSGTLKGLAKVLDGSIGKVTAEGVAEGVAKAAIGSISPGWGAGVALYDQSLDGLLAALIEAAAGKFAPGVEQFISGFNTGFSIGALLGETRVQMAAAGLQFNDPPLPQSGAGALDPWRRPLWVARDEAVGVSQPHAPPSTGVFAGTGAGELALRSTQVVLAGPMTISGAGTILVDEVPDDVAELGWTIDRWSGPLDAADVIGEVGVSSSGVSLQASYLDATSSGGVDVRRVLDDGTREWARLEGGSWALTATTAAGRIDSGEVGGDEALLASGANAWPNAQWEIDAATGELVAVATSAGVTLEGVSATESRTVGERWSVTPVASGDVDGASMFGVEAPAGWRVDLTDTGYEVWPRGAGAGTYVVQTWLEGDDGVVTARQATAVTLSDGAAGLEVELEYTPLFTIEVDGVPYPMVARAVVRNTGPLPAEVMLDASTTAGFTVDAPWTGGVLGPGEDALVWLPVEPDGTMPAPGGTVELTVTATAGDTDASERASWTVPSATGVSVESLPVQPTGQPGSSGTVQIRVTGRGNAAGTIEILATPAADITYTGLPDSFEIMPEETRTFDLEWTLDDAATPGFAYGSFLDFMQGEVRVGTGLLTTFVVSPAMDKAFEVADEATFAAPGVMTEELYELGLFLADFSSGCDGNDMRELEFRLDALAAAAEGTVPDLIIAELRAQADVAADSDYSCDALDLDWLCATLEQLGAALVEIDDALGARLLVRDLTFPSRITSGEALAIRAVLTNEDDDPSEAAIISVSTRQRGAAVPIATVEVPALAAGDTWPLAFDWPTDDALGTYVIEVTGPRNEEAALVTVDFPPAPEGNRAPVFTADPPLVVNVGVDVEIPFEVIDPDGDAVFVAVASLPAGFRLEGTSVVGQARQVGTLEFSLLANDRFGAASTLTFEVDASFATANEPPFVTSTPPRRALVSALWAYQPVAIDPDGTDITWRTSRAPAGVSTGADALSWTPTSEQVGVHWFDLEAVDADGNETLHSFPVTVAIDPIGADLSPEEPTLAFAPDASLRFDGAVDVAVSNGGDVDAAAHRLSVRLGNASGEEVGTLSLASLAAGQRRELSVDVAGEFAFPGQPLAVVVDADAVVPETDENNNVSSSAGRSEPSEYAYMAAPPTEAQVVLLAPDRDVAFRIIDPITRRVATEGVAEAGIPTFAEAALRDGDSVFALSRFAIETDRPVQAYVVFEIFDPEIGGDLFHPARDGSRVGREFLVYVPTSSGSNGLFVTALEAAEVVRATADGTEVERLQLAAGQTWEVQDVDHGDLLQLLSDGDLVVQSASVTGAVMVPPTDADTALRGDVGRSFVFSTRSRGLGGGALGVVAYEDASYSLEVAEGTLLSGTLSAGEFAFHAGIGELRGAQLLSTGDVAVMAGDIARLGADRIGLMGEDLVQTTGRDQRSFVVHTLENDAIVPYVFAGPQPTTVTVDGEASLLGAFERLVLPANAMVAVESSAPIVIQTMGGGDRFFDYAAVLPTLTPATGRPVPVLHAVAIDDSRCGTSVTAAARVGNAGAVALPAGAVLELSRVVDGASTVVATASLEAALGSGDWVDIMLEAPGVVTAASPSWIVRLDAPGLDAPSVTRPGAGSGTCTNDPPVFETTPPSATPRGELLRYTARAVDPEGGNVRYDLVNAPVGTSLHPVTGQLEWNPRDEDSAGDFAIAASDERGGIALQSFRVGVIDDTCEPEQDTDDDGFCPPADCDDTRREVFPGATEIPGDGLDNDCDPSTSDALPDGGVTVELSSTFDRFARGTTVPLEVEIIERTGLASFETLAVTLAIECAGTEVLEATESGIMLDPSERVVIAFDWQDTSSLADRCTATATLVNGELELDQDALVIELVDALIGSFTGVPAAHRPDDTLQLGWTIDNTTDLAITTDVLVRRADRVTPIAGATVTLAANGSATGGGDVDTTNWPEAALQLQLVSGNTLLDEVSVAVIREAAVGAPEAPGGRGGEWLDSSDASAIAYRPDGPEGDVTYPGAVQAAWSTDGLTLGITQLRGDVSELQVTIWRRDEVFGQLRWTSADEGGARTEQTPRGPRLVWQVSDGVALEPGETLRMVVVAEASEQTWWWTSGGSVDPADAGLITLLDGDLQVADPAADAGSMDGTSGSDATTDTFTEDGVDGAEGGSVEKELGSGCDCRAATGSRPPDAGLLLLLALALLRRRPTRHSVWAAMLVVGLAACGGGSPTEVLDASFDGTDGADGGTGGSVTPGDAGFDGGMQDGGGDDDVDPGPIVPPDAGQWVDTPVPPTGDGQTGEECESDDDCASGICQQGAEFSVCTERCSDDDCPEGFSCEPYPGGVELCVAVAVCLDEDGDGYGRGAGCIAADCDDADERVYSDAAEVCDGVDNNCDGDIDEDVRNACGGCGDVPLETCNGFDDDCDGEVDEGVANACGRCGEVPVEVCNGLDDDCDGTPDDGVCLDCELGETRSCYAADAETENVGLCTAGIQRCESSGWSVCLDATLPVDEVCDGQDNDCDGEADEGLLNACGTCGSAPVEICNGLDDDCDGDIDEGVLSPCGGCTPCGESRVFPFERGAPDPTIAPAPDGAITLGTGLLERHDIWVPNSNEDTVSRWDTRTGRELARYWIGEDPSRTAVDLDGNVWIGNRGDGIVTHIFGDPDRCIDRNGDGVIQTSRDLNGDGLITGAERLPEAQGNALADECVHCQVRVGTETDLVRGVGVDAENHAWVGTWVSKELYEIDPETCEILTQIGTGEGGGTRSSSSVYGIAIDPDGDLWTSGYTEDCMPRVDTRTGETREVICESRTRYGMAIAPDGTLWFGGANAEIHSYTPSTGEWATFAPPEGGLALTAGIVVDASGIVYVAGYNSNNVGRFDPETGTWQLFETNNPPTGFVSQTLPRGVTIDAEGHIWTIARGSSGLVEMTDTGEWLGSYDIVATENPNAGTGPYSYSDNTGFQLFNIVAREGVWRDRFDVGAPVQFLEIDSVTVEPDGTSIELRFRMGGDPTALDGQEWSEWAPAAGLTDLRAAAPEDASILDVQYRLQTDDPEIRPVLRAVTVRYETADCRLAATGCPSGQLCDPVYGGCFAPPTECSRDAQCELNEYCDDTGSCRIGCRLTTGSCPEGLTCDPESHRCLFRTFECGSDSDCADGSWCTDGGYCEEGCRLSPDSCPVGFRCGASARECVAVPPECLVDSECATGNFCNGAVCVPGCRLDNSDCAEGLERCDEASRLCVPLPEACDPAAISDEICDGIDNDCNGVVDDLSTDVGTSCSVGPYLTGSLTCMGGSPVCVHDGSQIPSGTPLTLYASAVLDLSSQRFATSWGANQALGPADANTCREDSSAWAPAADGPEPEFLHLSFDEPLDASMLRVREVSNAPFVTRIDAVLADGRLVEGAWEGVDDTACDGWLEAELSLDGPVREVIIHTAADGREHIDAVELIGTTTRVSDPIVVGPVENVGLGPGSYRVSTDRLEVIGALYLDDGATIGREDGGTWELSRQGSGNSTWGAADLVEASVDWRGDGALVLDGTTLRADPASDRHAYFATDIVRADGATFSDVPGETSNGTALVMTSSRLLSTSGTDWQWTLRGTGDFVRTEFLGENVVPRRSNGLLMFGSANIVESDISSMQTGVELRSVTATRVTRSSIRNCDENVAVVTSGRGEFEDVVLDLSDPGHYGVGVSYRSTNPSGGVAFDGIEFRATNGDQPIELDIDAFHEDSVTSWGDISIEGIDADAAVAISGAPTAGVVTVAPLPFTSTYRLASDISIYGTVELRVNDVALWATPATVRTWSLNSQSPVTFTGTTLENVLINHTSSTNTLVLDDVTATIDLTSGRSLVSVRGGATIRNSSFESLGTPSSTSNRIHTGVYGLFSGDVTISGTQFTNFQYGVFLEDDATFDVSDSTFTRCQTGVRIQERAVGALSNLTLMDDSDLVSSTGIDLRFDSGGTVEIDGLQLNLGADDRGISIDPDVFSNATPSSFANLAFGDTLIERIGLRGDSDEDAVTMAPIGAESTLFLYETTRLYSPAAVIAGGLTLESAANGVGELHVSSDTDLTIEDGASFLDVYLRSWGTVDAQGTRFEGTGRSGSPLVEVEAGAITLTDCTLIASRIRAQDGAYANNGTTLTINDSVLTDLDEAVYVYTSGTANLNGTSFEDVRIAISATGGFHASLDGCSFVSGDDVTMMGIYSTSPADGLALDVQNSIWDLGPEHAAVRLPYEAFTTGRTVTFGGSTAGPRGVGAGYQVYGANDLGPVTLGHMEPFQTSWRLNGSLTTYAPASLTIPPGTVFTTDGFVRVLDLNTGTTFDVDDAEFYDVQLRADGDASGTVDDSLFVGSLIGRQYLNYLTSTGAITIRNTEYRAEGAATGTRGIQTTSDAANITIDACTFDSLSTGVYAQSTPPVLTSPTFINCTEDTVGFD